MTRTLEISVSPLDRSSDAMNDLSARLGAAAAQVLRFIAAAMALALPAACGQRGYGGCQLPGSPPGVAGTPIPPQPVPSNAGVTSSVTVTVKVVVNAGGGLTSASIVTSSGNAIIDQDALALVANSKFYPGSAGCGETSAPDATTVTITFNPPP